MSKTFRVLSSIVLVAPACLLVSGLLGLPIFKMGAFGTSNQHELIYELSFVVGCVCCVSVFRSKHWKLLSGLIWIAALLCAFNGLVMVQ